MKNLIKYFKQETITVILGLIIFYLLNMLLSTLFPNSAFFDFYSEIENILFGGVRLIFIAVFAWILLRVVFPNVFKFIRDEFYDEFPLLDRNMKYILGTAIFLVFLLVSSISAKAQVRNELFDNLTSQLDVREVTNNSSVDIDQYLEHVGFHKPVAWCAAFVSWNLSEVGVDNPCSAWSPNYAKKKDVIWKHKNRHNPKLKLGDVCTFYYASLKRVGHVGFYINTTRSGNFITIEGNTNNGGSRTGDGVYLRKRRPSKVYAVSRYIKEGKL